MKLPVTLTLPSARQTTQALTQALADLPAGGTFCVDASGLADLDTSALAVLLQARRDALGSRSATPVVRMSTISRCSRRLTMGL